MILTGDEIRRMLEQNRLTIEPYDPAQIEPNAYGCRLGSTLLEYSSDQIDARTSPTVIEHHMPEEGMVLLPNRFYLGSTCERIGSTDFASELYANRSTASCGIFVQTSAPLGHTGAVIRWTLEIVVAQPIRVYPGMKAVKVCFWANHGAIKAYEGRYRQSMNVTPSMLFQDGPAAEQDLA